MEIVNINQAEIRAHAELMTEVFGQEPWNEEWDIQDAHDRLLCYKNAPLFLGLSAIDHGELKGFVLGNFEPYQKSSHFHVKEMCVKKESQRQGVGKKLINSLHNILESKDVGSAILLTRKGSPAESFYFKCGYKLAESMGLYSREIST